jgi:hypothetical protein
MMLRHSQCPITSPPSDTQVIRVVTSVNRRYRRRLHDHVYLRFRVTS